jgi:repressor LexA
MYQRSVELPLLGSVAAGAPLEAMHTGETLSVPDGFLRKNGSHYVLRVKGDSMIEEHIRDGDYVVINDKQAADNGEMVIALLDGSGATVKRYYRERDGRIRLQPANETMQPMFVHEDDVRIQGIVGGVLRRY